MNFQYIIWMRISFNQGKHFKTFQISSLSIACGLALVVLVCRLIADYFQRPQMNEHFSHVVEHMNEAMLPMEFMEVNSSYVPKWLSPLLARIFLAMFRNGLSQDRAPWQGILCINLSALDW